MGPIGMGIIKNMVVIGGLLGWGRMIGEEFSGQCSLFIFVYRCGCECLKFLNFKI